MNKLLISLIFLSATQAYSMETINQGVRHFAQRRNHCIQALAQARLTNQHVDVAIMILEALKDEITAYKAQFAMNLKVQKMCQTLINSIDVGINNQHITMRPRRIVAGPFEGQEEPDSLYPTI